MASKAFFVAATIVAVVVAPAFAADYIVGDDIGWTVDFDYQAWTQGKTFYVGDRLIFNYKPEAHNVHKVNGAEFQQCAPPLTSQPLTSGKDVIPLSTPGRKWYICGVSDHCAAKKMKFVITVMPQVGSPAPTPSPTPTSPPSPTTPAPPSSAATGIVSSKSFAWLIAALALSSMY